MTLQETAYVVGAALVVLHAPLIAAAGKSRAWLTAFPRSRAPAIALTAIDLTWVVTVMLHASLGRFEAIKPALYVAGPAAFFAAIVYLDEFLAARALGGFLLLIANPVLNAARWHSSDLRLVVTVLAYAWVVAGCVFVLSPYRCRDWLAFFTHSEARLRAAGIAGAALGAAVLALAAFIY